MPTDRAERRRMLGSLLALSAVGLGTIAGLDRVLRASAGQVAASDSPAAQELMGASITVTASYVGMPLSVTGTKEETFALASPAYLTSLVEQVEERHPLLSPMMPAMTKLVDGGTAMPTAILEDGDEVCFLAASAGG